MSLCAALSPAGRPPADDLCLLTAVRLGDRRAFGQLYSRHVLAARAYARRLAPSAAEADDVVAESFANVLEHLLAGRGPRDQFRPYLLRTIRNDVYDRARRASQVRPSDDLETIAGEQSVVDRVETDLEHRLVTQAYASLPDRWRRTLWHTAVEGRPVPEVARLLGSTTTNVTSIAFRARERLRQAYLDRYLADQGDSACGDRVRGLGAYVRGGLGARATAEINSHLRCCRSCRLLVDEVREVSTTMRAPACRTATNRSTSAAARTTRSTVAPVAAPAAAGRC